MGIGPVPAVRKLLDRAAISVSEIDLVELNEAFAAQSIPVIRELGLDRAIVNVNGGAIALGHPLGMSGARLVVSLLHELKRRGGRYGLATLCVGVGQGQAALFERVRPATRTPAGLSVEAALHQCRPLRQSATLTRRRLGQPRPRPRPRRPKRPLALSALARARAARKRCTLVAVAVAREIAVPLLALATM